MSDSDLTHVTASEFAKRFARYRMAAQRGPAAVTHHNTVTEVLISKHDFDEYQRLKAHSTKAMTIQYLSDEMLTSLRDARMDPRHDGLNGLLDEDAR
jgi:uncharacterized protein with von Willebrand factor type A (vWA) domain